MSPDKVYIIILNWNGWRDTLECLESVFRNDYPDYQVVVCDNRSTDGSLAHIKAWAEGREIIEISGNQPLSSVALPPVPKPILYAEYGRDQAEAGGTEEMNDKPLILIQTDANLGFAGGNNVGLRYVIQRNDFQYVWLLNNDTVMRRDALTMLVARSRESGAGICGSKIPYYAEPDKIWALGGATYNKWLAVPRCIGLFQPSDQPHDRGDVEERMAYVAGASMLVSRAFLRDIGLMCEDYFLYYEELDWSLRSKGRYRLAYAPDSVVYHKISASITQNQELGDGGMAEYYMNRNALLITRRFAPFAFPLVWMRVKLQYGIKKSRVFMKRVKGGISRRAARAKDVLHRLANVR